VGEGNLRSALRESSSLYAAEGHRAALKRTAPGAGESSVAQLEAMACALASMLVAVVQRFL
jgi:hypothetical protein